KNKVMENALTVKLTDTQKNELIRYYTDKIKEMEAMIHEYQGLLSQLTGEEPKRLTPFTFTVKTADQVNSEYKKNWSWSAKIRYVLRKQGHCLTSREIVYKIMDLEPELTDDIINSVSGSISSKISKNVVFGRYKPYEGSENYI